MASVRVLHSEQCVSELGQVDEGTPRDGIPGISTRRPNRNRESQPFRRDLRNARGVPASRRTASSLRTEGSLNGSDIPKPLVRMSR